MPQPLALANNIDLLTTEISQYFAQPHSFVNQPTLPRRHNSLGKMSLLHSVKTAGQIGQQTGMKQRLKTNTKMWQYEIIVLGWERWLKIHLISRSDTR